MKILKIALIVFFLLNCVFIFARENPLTGEKLTKVQSSLLQKSSLWHTIAGWQKDMNSKLNRILKDMKHDFKLKYFLILISVSLLFGVLHAIGPGHGKMIVGAYFLKEKSSPINALKLGSIIAITHSGLAILLGIIFGIIVKSMKMHGRIDIQNYMGIISGAFITLLGTYYLWQKVKSREHFHYLPGKKNEILLGIFSGMIPCPVSMTIILFSIYLDVFFFGFLSVLFFSVGMACTISLLGFITIKSRHLISRISIKNKQKAQVMQKVFGIVTSLLIIIIGLSLIFTRL
jgi:ABC-type nickel/cobalt efflux system permease component RcnA